MPARATFALILGIALAGCEDLHSNYLSARGPGGQEVRVPKPPPREPGTEAAALRAIGVAQKILDADKALPRPTILTLGSPKKAIFHTGNAQAGLTVFISDSLVKACEDDAQLAAVLCTQLGRIAAERANAAFLQPERAPVEERVSTDDRGSFGPADGTRMMLAAKQEAEAKKRTARADPAAIARQALVKAGYSPKALAQVAGLLAEADRDDGLAEHFTAGKSASLMKPVPKPDPKK